MEQTNILKGTKALVWSQTERSIRPVVIEEIQDGKAVLKYEGSGRVTLKKLEKLMKFDQGILTEAKSIERNIQSEMSKMQGLPLKLVRLVPEKPKSAKKANGGNGKAESMKADTGKVEEPKAQTQPKRNEMKKAA